MERTTKAKNFRFLLTGYLKKLGEEDNAQMYAVISELIVKYDEYHTKK